MRGAIALDEKDHQSLPLYQAAGITAGTRTSSPPHQGTPRLIDVVRSLAAKRRTRITFIGLICCIVVIVRCWQVDKLGVVGVGNWGTWLADGEYAGSPLTELGKEADHVFKLGTLNPRQYQQELEDFLRRHFPEADWNETDPNSLINDMRRFFLPASSSRSATPPPIPLRLFQTAPTEGYYGIKQASPDSFRQHNANLSVVFHDNDAATEFITTRFSLDDKVDRGIVAAWSKLDDPPVLRSDTWRYLMLATQGGIYADTDVESLQPFSIWGENPSWEAKLPNDYKPPSLIVGIEADVGDRHDWHQWWPRPLQISQWTIAASRGHPVLIDTLRRVVELALSPEPRDPRLSVMERTGPGVFTDALLRYVRVQWNIKWPVLRALEEDGWRYRDEKRGVWGDTKVLSITGFSPGVGHMQDKGTESLAAMARHLFAGSWKEQDSTPT